MLHIACWPAKVTTALVAADHRAGERVGTTEHARHILHAALRKQPTQQGAARGRDARIAKLHLHGLHHLHTEPQLHAQAPQKVDVATTPLAKLEVRPLDDSIETHIALEPLDEVLCLHAEQRGLHLEHAHLVRASVAQRLQTLGGQLHVLRRQFGPKQSHGMRLEGDGHHGATRSCDRASASKQRLVTQVHAVEIADGEAAQGAKPIG